MFHICEEKINTLRMMISVMHLKYSIEVFIFINLMQGSIRNTFSEPYIWQS